MKRILICLILFIGNQTSAENHKTFGHGCGTGCTVNVSLTNVTNLGNGVSKGTFLRKFTGGGRGDFNGTLT